MSFATKISGKLQYMTAPNIAVPHAFTTRCGGVSQGVFESLNLANGRGDTDEAVTQNYEIMGCELGFSPKDIVRLRQVHGDDIRVITALPENAKTELTEADAMITNRAKIPLLVFTADCVPILLHDPVGGAVAAIHSGWRGTVRDIAGKACEKMRDELGCRISDIRAAIGPCISKCCFETGAEVPAAVGEILGEKALCFIEAKSETGKFMVDLKGINNALLIRAGVLPDNISVSDECTSCMGDKYWSHRKMGETRGSQGAFIMLRGDLC